MANKFNPLKAKVLGWSSLGMGILAILVGLALYFTRPEYEGILTVLIVLLAVGILNILMGFLFLYTAKLAMRHFMQSTQEQSEK